MSSRTYLALMSVSCLALGLTPALAQGIEVEMHEISSSGIGEKVGTVQITGDGEGLTLSVKVAGIPPGDHGFHLHEKGDCGPGEKDGKMQAGIAAGGHYDPEETKSHEGPEGHGHKGDLPVLEASADGVIDASVAAPRLKLSDVGGRALVIHEGGDTYSDTPEMGGGKGRIVCGVISAGP